MKRFKPLLRDINNRLDLPQPLKSRVILEISGDMEEMFNYYLEKGDTEQEAEKKTLDKFSISDASLSELISLHTSQYKKWINNLTSNARSTWEKTLLTVVLLIIFVTFYNSITGAPFFNNTSIFTWPVLVLFFVTIGALLEKVYRLYIIKEHKSPKIRSGLDAIFYLIILMIFVGASGYFSEQYISSSNGVLSGEYFFLGLITNAESLSHSVNWMIRSTSLMMTTLGVSSFALLFWFILSNKTGRIEEAEVSVLLDDH